jgi:hypothetical protein
MANQKKKPNNTEMPFLVFFIFSVEKCGQKPFNEQNVAKGIAEYGDGKAISL